MTTTRRSERGREGPVERAIRRWVELGLLDLETAARLEADAVQVRARARQRFIQYVLAATAALVTVIAGGVLFSWVYPELGVGARSVLLGALGGALAAAGVLLEGARERAPAGYALQTAGLVLVLVAYAHSESVWGNGSLPALLAGALVLAVPLVMAPLAAGRNPVMPAVLTALGYAFLLLFLVRGVGIQADEALWVLNGVLLLSMGVLAWRIRKRTLAVVAPAPAEGVGTDAGNPAILDPLPGPDPSWDPGRRPLGWELGAFTAALHVAPVLILATALGPLGLRDRAVLPLDVWWLGLTGLTLWAIHGAPPVLRRPWIPRQLGWAVVLGVVLASWTVMGPLGGSARAAGAAVAALGALALWHALSAGIRETVAPACLALVAAALYVGAESGGAPGAALALGASAALLYWVSGRLGREMETVEEGT